MKRARAFTLVEILIVIVLLGVLAAIVIPAVAGHGVVARRASLAVSLNLLRRFVPVYTGQHLEVAPGYPDGNPGLAPTDAAFVSQATESSNIHGQTAARGTPGFPYGPYLSRIPVNQFNNLSTIQMLGNGEAFPADADDSHGWVYKPATGEIRPDNTGTDDSGTRYYDY